jgi:hypothetical protein
VRDSQNADQVTSRSTHRLLGGFQQFAMAIASKGDFFFIDRRAILFHCGAIIGPKEIGKRLVDEVVVGLADNFPFARAKELLESLIAGQINTLRVFQPDQVRQGVDH